MGNKIMPPKKNLAGVPLVIVEMLTWARRLTLTRTSVKQYVPNSTGGGGRHKKGLIQKERGTFPKKQIVIKNCWLQKLGSQRKLIFIHMLHIFKCLIMLMQYGVFMKSVNLLCNEQTTKIIFNALEENYALCLLGKKLQ